MRIAVVLNTSWNIYNFRMGLIKHLIGEGHEVVAVAPKDTYTEHLISAGCKFVNLTMDSRGINPIKDAALTYELYKIYKSESPDIILHFTIKPNIYGSIAARIAGIPVINNVSGLGTVFLWNNYASKLALLMYRFAFSSADFVFFQNSDDRLHFIDKVGIQGLKTGLLPGSGINTNRYKPAPFKSEGKFTFLMIARLLIDKGVYEYVEAVRQLKQEGVEAEFQLLGNIETIHKRGIPLVQVKEWIDEGLINYRGTTDDIASYITSSSCVVLPSYREGTPRTLLEGASMAKPLIATNVPGCNSVVIDGENGFLCNVRDQSDLAEKMRKMFTLAEEDRLKMGEKSRELVVRDFDESIVIDAYEKTIYETLSGLETPAKKTKHFSQAAAVNL